jgi:hypothetical protein
MGQVNSIRTPWGKFNMTPASQPVAFKTNALGEMQPGDMIGAFDLNNNLCGFVEISSTSVPQVITLFADDVTTLEKDGFTEGENISFRLYRAETGEEFMLTVVYDNSFDNSTGSYFSNSLSAITGVVMDITAINSVNNAGISIYPNPADDYLVITISENDFSGAELTVIDTKGRNVLENRISTAKTTLDISPLQTGIYFIKIKTNSKNEISKLIVR